MLADPVGDGPVAALVHGPVIVGEPPLLADLEVPPRAGALVVMVHENSADGRAPGQRFIADVLQANRFCTLSFGLRTAEECAGRLPPPGLDEARERIRRVINWVAAHPALRHRCLALMGIADAVPACIAAARLPVEPFVHSMVLVDGRLESTGPALSQLEVPTLLLAGRSDAMALARHLAINESLEVHCRTPSDGLANAEPSASSDGRSRSLPPGQAKGLSRCRHRVDLIPNTTRPVAEPGALESIACATTAWFGRTLPPPRHAPAGCIASDGTAAD